MRLRLLLSGSLLLLAGTLSSPAEPREEPPAATLPFGFAQSFIRLDVHLEGKGPYRMLLDTGTNVTVLDRAVAAQLELKLGSPKKVSQYFGTEEAPTYQPAELRQVRIGGLAMEEVQVAVTDLAPLARRISIAGEPLHGVLGYAGILHRRALRIDYPNRTLTLSSRSPLTEEVEKAPPSPERVLLPFGFGDGLLERIAGVHGGPKLRVKVNGKAAEAQIDTGYNGSLALTHEATEALGLAAEREGGELRQGAGAGGTFTHRTGQLQRVELGPLVVERPRVLFLSPAKGRKRSYGLNIGNDFLQRWVVTLDYRKKKVLLETPGAPPAGPQREELR